MILLDSNVLLEVLEHRRYYAEVIKKLSALQNNSLAITVLTASNVFYIAERDKLDFLQVENLIASYNHVAILPTDVAWALNHYKRNDFEDALQIAAALRINCEIFLTLDSALNTKYGKYLKIELIR